MLRALYDWTLSLAARKTAELWLALIAFIESSVFLIPADVLFLPMGLARPERAYRYAVIATLASTAGGIAGYFLGHYAFEEIAKPILAFYDKVQTFEQLRSSASRDAVLLMLPPASISACVTTWLAVYCHVSPTLTLPSWLASPSLNPSSFRSSPCRLLANESLTTGLVSVMFPSFVTAIA